MSGSVLDRPAHAASPHAQAGPWFPLSAMQAAYLVGRGDTLALGRVSSHVYHEILMEGCDPDRLEAALCAVVARHEALRTIIDPEGRQAILPMQDVPTPLMTRHDHGRDDEQAAQAAIHALRRRLSAQVAPLARPCALEAVLVALPAGRHMLLVSHEGLHIDGLSMQILFADWAAAYARPDATLEALAPCVAPYVAAEQREREGPGWHQSRDRWLSRQARDGLHPPRLPLATDPDKLAQGLTGRFEASLDAQAWTRFQAHAGAAGVTPAAAVFAAYCDVLSRWDGTHAKTLNVTLAYRPPVSPDIDAAIGNFTRPVLATVTGTQPRFDLRAKAAQAALMEALDLRHFTALDAARHLASASPGQATLIVPYTFNFALADAPGHGPLQGVETLGTHVHGVSQTPQVWLNLFVMRQRGGIVLQLDAVTGLFAPGVPACVADSLGRLLGRLADSPQAWQEAEFDLLPAAQRQARERANRTDKPVPVESLHAGFLRHTQVDPGRPAVLTASRGVTRGDLLAQARAIAQRLVSHGVQAGEPVAICLPKSPEQVAAVLGASLAGAAYVPIATDWPDARQDEITRLAQARVLVTREDLPLAARYAGERLFVEDLAPDGDLPRVALGNAPDRLAYVLYTSGSTGAPKGVMIGQGSVVNLVHDATARFSVQAGDRALGLSAFHFDLSVFDIFGVLHAGGALVLPDPDKAADPAHWLDLMERFGVTLLNTVPAVAQMLVAHCDAIDAQLPETLRLVMLSGDRIPPSLPGDLRRRSRARIASLGGPTETTVWNIFHPIDTPVPPHLSRIPYGRPLANSRYHVLDAALNDCPDWVVGELHASGAGLAQGYWRDPLRTAQAFITHPRNGERLYKTGDLGRYLPDGSLEIVGRADFQVKLHGQRVELTDIEARLASHPLVRACAVTGPAPDHDGLTAHVVLAGDAKAPPPDVAQQLKAHVAAQLPAYMVPTRVLVRDALPLSENGKVDRQALHLPPAPSASAAAPASPPDAPPASPSPSAEGGDGEPALSAFEQGVARIWSELLKREIADLDQNFFDLGGDSIKAARLMARLRKEFAVSASLAQVMQHQTVRGMARFVAANGRARATP
ncbi:Siderophore biosynthesis non-ribosomal peptide synthetase modules [plant metagenome]|uniref:Siderophore biosynthesis non-ribosomal peptide synthetase modules n=1 Tax=plant metagenome TaxID=1297885 RepID=A0A484T8D9_9ZZZZ